ncbi:unnamed protein product [Phaedon cochleariae]|uniref:Uncharacterized protein n=1 Tax=Phaedon cochleariae TaxID=80249 RepID=A0A9N9WX06_PHACE|nr:unnamed protein product [Phaedon cochleariae]
MELKHFAIVPLLCLCGLSGPAMCIENLLVDQLRLDFLRLEDELWDLVLDRNHRTGLDDPGLEIISKFHTFDNTKMNQMPQGLLHGLRVARQADTFLLLYSDLKTIDDMYHKFRKYLSKNMMPTNKEDYNEYRREISTTDMIDDILYDVNNVNKTTRQIVGHVFTDQPDLLWKILDILSSDDFNCKYPNQPMQQVFYNLYTTVALADLKGYVMAQFAYLALRVQEKGNHTEVALRARNEYKLRVNNTISTMRGAIEITSGKIWRCDPKHHVKGVTYDEVTRLLQGHIQNEVDLNEDGTCTGTCADYYSTKSYGCYDGESEYCKKMKPCYGKILDCRFVESNLKACIAPVWDSRRYEYIEFKSGLMMGEKSRCNNKNVFSWNRWFVHCSNCICLCDEQGSQSDRYFSLRPVMADVQYNRVVTGLRFIKHNRIFHLQIQEGELLPYGYIDNSTVRWVPVDDFRITTPGVKKGQDYHTMDHEERTMFMDNLAVEKQNHVITGVKFDLKGGNLQLKINVREFDFKSGQLSYNFHHLSGVGYGQKIDISYPDIPIKAPHSTPEWDYPTFVRFTHTDFNKDLAQTTVPFIDIQDVAPEVALPLRALGIYYKGKKGYGGFVAPTITTYDFGQHLEVDFPEANQRIDQEELFKVLPN